jgi:hypothetical protein
MTGQGGAGGSMKAVVDVINSYSWKCVNCEAANTSE